jgi:hypothetical protein
MARSINSPGVQIIETDLSQYQEIRGGTTVFVPGFAPQGPTDEILLITSISEFEQIYGIPEAPAEKYFYYSVKELLNSPATLLTTRLPYGSGLGTGFAPQKYSALFYPVASSNNVFEIGEPKHVSLTESEYIKVLQNDITWSAISNAMPTPSYSSGAVTAGIIVLNNAQTTVNESYEGYYVSIADNLRFGPKTAFDAVTRFVTLTGDDDFAVLRQGNTRLDFALSGNLTRGIDSVSEAIETIPTFNFGNVYYNDSLVLNVFKVRNSIYEPQKLTYTVAETHIGSLDPKKKTIGAGVGTRPFNLQQVVNSSNKKSPNIKLYLNPRLQRVNWTSLSSVNPSKSVRLRDAAKGMYTFGTFQPSYLDNTKTTGEIQEKLERALTLIESTETITVDLLIDGGLSTIAANASGLEYFDDTKKLDTEGLSNYESNTNMRWRTVFDTFENFAKNVRKDCMFIADPVRQIFVNGADSKTLSDRTKNFTTNIYTPLEAQFETINTNYAATYANWVKVFDSFSDGFIWLPSSGFVAAAYARSDANTHPWIAPAGLTRGQLNNIVDLAFNPNQKQRDFLYTISINPIVAFANEGFVIYGQKTLQGKPSAFDRVNVRRLFLTLERTTQNALKYFVFEPNTIFTRNKLRATIQPIFELAKNTEGIYDYLIVCDDRNNTPDVIDRNELAVDIYIKPVKAAEFILVNFIATRTGQNFSELIQ